ncbi:TadE-like protein [Burkholderia sp. Ch1-1]|uniref:TadE-like protein n=1 Tax=Paraburkholderia dioscoreae TaxID=2604047 RepID=A0A5Q4ZHR4_9BURK|nr:TadE/TadG family type IV pilus assembly protein [Paraburkholderia dioscoreae]EIF35533.1 TadE-like protein [Burkholderia sp. Ch1-1]VVD31431.1 TadE-like protein [Paraburkholderia dioscoreae]
MNPPHLKSRRIASRRTRLTGNARKSMQSGQSMTEFIIVAPVLLFVCFGILQFVLLYQAKSTLDAAVLEAAREGAVNHGSMQSMRSGLARGLAPIYAHQANAEGVAAALASGQTDAANFSSITVLNPTPAAIQDYSRPRYYADQAATYSEIPNDSLMYRDPSVPPGATSHMNIQDANLLKIHVHYCYNMYVPLVNKVIYYAANVIGTIGAGGILTREPANVNQDPYGDPQNGDYLCRVKLADGIATGRWPISLDSEAMVRMQSPLRASALNDSPNPTGN